MDRRGPRGSTGLPLPEEVSSAHLAIPRVHPRPHLCTVVLLCFPPCHQLSPNHATAGLRDPFPFCVHNFFFYCGHIRYLLLH